MKNKNLSQSKTAAIIAPISFLLFFAVFTVLFIFSKYALFILTGIALFLPAVINLLFLAFSKDITVKSKDVPSEDVPQNKFKRLIRRVLAVLKSAPTAFIRFYNKRRTVIKAAALLLWIIVCATAFVIFMKSAVTQVEVSLWQPIVAIALLVLCVVADMICKHAESGEQKYNAIVFNCKTFFIFAKILITICVAVVTLKALNIFDACVIAKYVIATVFLYTLIFTLLSIVILIIKGELDSNPQIVIPIPFTKGDMSFFNLIEFLENNTGITMRGLWSMKYIKQIAPLTLGFIVLFLWLSTSIVQVEPYQQAAVYRLGKLDKTIESGLHLVLPYPIDKVEIYDTDVVKKITVGYESDEDTDNTWTGNHGLNEFKLLLGGGDEVVSINLRIEYRIRSLHTYLEGSADPEQLLEAMAYSVITDATISTDLSSLLSVNRETFANSLRVKLTQKLNKYSTGIDIVSVVLESIHPPIEVADAYQELIGAGITAEQRITEANGYAAKKKAEAEKEKDTAINKANADKFTKIAAAKAEVSEFTAGAEAYKKYPSAYRYYKYLGAITEAYKKANLVIVGDGVDSSKIYFGNFKTENSGK